MSTTADATDVIRVATRAYRNGSVRGVRTYLHVNCDCRIGSTLMGTYGTMDGARRKAAELVKGTGDHVRTCSKSGPVKAAVRVHRFHDTRTAYRAAFSGLGVRDGDLVVVEPERVVAVVIRTAVCAISAARGHLLYLGTPIRDYKGGQYSAAADHAEVIAGEVGAVIDETHLAAPAPTGPALPSVAARHDGVTTAPDGRDKWIVLQGRDLLGEIVDQGPGLKGGRFFGWAPYADTTDGTTIFSDDPAEIVDSIAQTHPPVTAAELAAETGVPLDDVLATVRAVDEELQAEHRRGILPAVTATRQTTAVTREAADKVRAQLLDRPARHA